MFKVFKYIFLANLYKRVKHNIFLSFFSLIAMVFVSFIMNDILQVANSENLSMVLVGKWILLLSLFATFSYNLFKIVTVALNQLSFSSPKSAKTQKILQKETLISKEEQVVKKYQPKQTQPTKEDKILNKEQLLTKSEQIMQKYTKEQ